MAAALDPTLYVDKVLEGLPLKQRAQLTNAWIATQLYSPERLPLRTIEAIGPTLRDCIVDLQRLGHNAALYFFELVPPALND